MHDRSTEVARERSNLITFVLGLGAFLILFDVTAVVVAMPGIAGDLGFAVAGSAWVIDAYSLALTGALLASGALADRFGRWRAMLAGARAAGAGRHDVRDDNDRPPSRFCHQHRHAGGDAQDDGFGIGVRSPVRPRGDSAPSPVWSAPPCCFRRQGPELRKAGRSSTKTFVIPGLAKRERGMTKAAHASRA